MPTLEVSRDVRRHPTSLPGAVVYAGLVLLGPAAVSAAAVVFAATSESPLARMFEAHPGLVNLVAVCAAVAAVLALEPPRSASPLAYARQLRARFLELQATFDAGDRRRPGEGKEKEDDRVPSEP